MNLELLNTLATSGTFFVIAATAIAAVIQLRHSRGSNQIAAFNEFQERRESQDFLSAQHFVLSDLSEKLKDPSFRYQIVHRGSRTPDNQTLIAKMFTVGNHYENMGLLVKMGFLDQNLVLQTWYHNAIGAWEALAPVVAVVRRDGDDAYYEHFEYLVVLAQDWSAAHPKGTYPRGLRRIDIRDDFLEADRQYAASTA